MWHSYLINLDRNAERLENSRRQFESEAVAFTRIHAVNGWELDESKVVEVYDDAAAANRYKYPLIKPEIGCYLSHVQAWRDIVESGQDGGFIFEDDFRFETKISPLLDALSNSGEPWDMVKLFSLKSDPDVLRSAPLTDTHTLTTPNQVPTCLLGYGLRREAAQRLLENSIPFFRPVDEDHKFFWEKDLRVDLVLPSPLSVGDQQTQTGTIGGARRDSRSSLMARIARGLRSLTYQLNYKAKLFYHRNIAASRHRKP